MTDDATDAPVRNYHTADIALLQRAIDISGMPARQFAVRVLIRDERTVRRWLAGASPIPAVVIDRCREIIARGRD